MAVQTKNLITRRAQLALLLFAGVLGICLLLPRGSLAGMVELSQSISYNRTNYSKVDYQWTRRLTTGIGYHFTEMSGIEFNFEDAVIRTHIDDYQDTTFHDQTYSISYLQSIFSKESMFQPFIRGGMGQLKRKATGTYAGGSMPSPRVDSLTVIIGGGFRLYITKQFAFKTQVISYLESGKIGTWKDNIALQGGISFFF